MFRVACGELREFFRQSRGTLARLRQSRLEFRFLQEAVGKGVDQAADGALRRLFLLTQCPFARGILGWRLQAAFIFLSQQLRIAQQLLHVAPHGFVQHVGADLRVLTNPLAAEAISIGPHAAVVGVAGLPFRGRAADWLAVVGIAAAAAGHESLQQMPRAASAFATELLVRRELLCDGGEEFLADDRRDGDGDLFGSARVVGRTRAARRFRASSRGTKLRPTLANACLAKCCAAAKRRVFQQSPDTRAVPRHLAARTQRPLLLQPTTNFADRQAVATDPLEELSHNGRLFGNKLVRRRAATVPLRHVAVSKRRAAQHVHRATLRCVSLAAPASFQNLGAFVLGEHALHLQQQIFLRRDPDGAVEEPSAAIRSRNAATWLAMVCS